MGIKQAKAEFERIIGFHSINIPSEWELEMRRLHLKHYLLFVSIQLISPASGNSMFATVDGVVYLSGFHSINIPSEWEFEGKGFNTPDEI